MNQPNSIEAKLDHELGLEKSKKKYGEPGSIMKSSDGKLYKVHEDGSWRRIKNVQH